MTLASALRDSNRQDLTEPIASAIAQIDGSIANLRNLIADLRPAALDALGAGAAIETLVAHLGSRTNIEIELASIDLAYERGIAPTRHVPEIEATLYRITQEALNNVLKHSNATTATVSVVEENGTITLTISDDGAGFDQSQRGTGFGLIGMRERVALVDGQHEHQERSRPRHDGRGCDSGAPWTARGRAPAARRRRTRHTSRNLSG